ncbi:hypothetical protein [Cohnella yongneupensis]|uniref:DNA topology modulation protein FlaR n=1 Tax=Cohnella yongneupensis TaxID=425006 RepID=A0ABW0QWR9_9BACL
MARALSKEFGIRHYETDNLVWDRTEDNLRYTTEQRDTMLAEIIGGDSWIIEGVHYKWGQDSFKEADVIYIFRPNRLLRELRVCARFVKTRLGIEKGNYKQSLRSLYTMIMDWNRGYDKQGMRDILALTEIYVDKRIIVRRNAHILAHMRQRYEHGGSKEVTQ